MHSLALCEAVLPDAEKASVILRRFSRALVWSLIVVCPQMSNAQDGVNIVEYFSRAQDARGAGLARKTKPVDVRPAKPGEVVVTMIKGEGKETQSPPAKSGDMVVRNRCPETGNEEILISAATFSQRYEGPTGAAGADGWLPYRPRGVEMRFVVVTDQDGSFSFTAPWGERMVAHPGDLIVQNPGNAKDTYRVAKAAFACTYEVLREPQR
jgi:hypothetical protein